MSDARASRDILGALVLLLLIVALPAECFGDVLEGEAVSASLQSLDPSCGIITQFVSPQIVVNPGVEFQGGQFTPNAGGAPLPVQQINSFGMDVDVFADSIRVIMNQIPGSISGLHSNFGPPLRLNVTNLVIPSGYLTGVYQTAGAAAPATLTSPTSIAIDFTDFSARTMDYQLLYVPEPAACGLLVIPLFTRRSRPALAKQTRR